MYRIYHKTELVSEAFKQALVLHPTIWMQSVEISRLLTQGPPGDHPSLDEMGEVIQCIEMSSN